MFASKTSHPILVYSLGIYGLQDCLRLINLSSVLMDHINTHYLHLTRADLGQIVSDFVNSRKSDLP